MKRIGLWAVVLCLATTVLRGADAPAHPTLALGSDAPDFDLPGIDGRNHTLAEYARADVLCVVFNCNHCPTAQAYEERIKVLSRRFTAPKVALVVISPNSSAAVRLDELGYSDVGDTLDEMKIRAKERGFNFPYLYDGENCGVAKKYGPVATPHAFVFDRARKLRYVGRIDDNERESLVKSHDLADAIEALVAGRTPTVAQTKVFGCSTKWDSKVEGNTRWMEKVRKEPVKLDAITAAGLKELVSQPSGKVRMIHLWATWCGPCVSEFDEIVETNLRFRHRDFELITVAAQFPDEQAKVERFLQKNHSSARNLIFADTDKYKMMEALDTQWNGELPYTLLVGADGKVLHRFDGALDFIELRRHIVAALNAVTPWKPATAPL